VSTLGSGQLLHLRLFIENVEVPIIGAMISASEGAPAAAQIEVIPTDTALRLRPRSKVLVFFLDDEDLSVDQDELKPEIRLARHLETGLPDDKYKLLYSGELFTTMYTKSGPGSRSLVLQCLDDSNIWDTSYIYSMKYSDNQTETAIAGNRAKFLALLEGAVQFDDILNKPEVVIRNIAARQRARSPNLARATGLIAGLFGVLELIGGVQGKYLGITAWHTVQEARTRLMDQIAGDSGKTAAALFDQASFESWLTNRIGDAGAVISFRQLIELINSYIYYSVFPNPVGVYKPGGRTVTEWPENLGTTPSSGGKLDPEFEEIINEMEWQLQDRWDGTVRPRAVITSTYRTLEDRNRIRADQGREPLNSKPRLAHDWGFAADFSLEGAGSGFVYGKTPATSLDQAESLHHRAITFIELEEIRSLEEFKLKGADVFTTEEFQRLDTLAEFYKDFGELANENGLLWGGDYQRSDLLWDLYGLGSDPVHCEVKGWRDEVGPDVLAAGVGTSPELEAFYKELGPRERLYTQFFRPDVWFAAPPACNLIFPEEVVSFTYTRQMMRETTRLQLATFNALYEELLLQLTYFAPGLHQVPSLVADGIGSAAVSLVYPHEKFSGVIPKYERISEVALYSRLSSENRIGQETSIPEDLQGIMDDVDQQVELWAERTAAFNFLSYRYSARNATVTMRFAPRLVAGWPALVVDRPAESGDVESRVANPTSPTHFLGMIRTLSHSVTQAGGQTSAVLSHARSHKAGDETDDLFASDLYDRGGILSTQVEKEFERTTEIFIEEGMSQENYTFCRALAKHLAAGGVVDPVPEAWKETSRPGDDGAFVLGPNKLPVRRIVTETQGVQTVAIGSVNDEQSAEGIYAFPFTHVTVVEIDEGFGLYPLEEAIRPPWISDEYSNEKIGELYEELMGCKSLMDLYALEPIGDYVAPTIAQAVEKVVQHYSAAVAAGGSASRLIRSLTERGYASLPQVIGTASGEGFYFQASGDFEKFEGDALSWIQNTKTETQIKPGEEQQVVGDLDPRKGRYDRVVAYQTELLLFQGLRG
jgi:hypothetical protein